MDGGLDLLTVAKCNTLTQCNVIMVPNMSRPAHAGWFMSQQGWIQCILPHSVHLGISALFKILQSFKLDHEVATERTVHGITIYPAIHLTAQPTHPITTTHQPTQPPTQPPTNPPTHLYTDFSCFYGNCRGSWNWVGVLMVSRGFLEVLWRVPGGCMKGVWKSSEGYLRVTEECLGGGVSEGYKEVM